MTNADMMLLSKPHRASLTAEAAALPAFEIKVVRNSWTIRGELCLASTHCKLTQIKRGTYSRLPQANTIVKPVIMDEATSALVTLTEAKLQHALADCLKDHSTSIVAYRSSAMVHARMRQALKDGTLAQRGQHSQLLQAQGLSRTLYA